ncbi:hypothetical protein [Paracoccus sp. ME4]|uniref:hypothetical protein n=1 Tax=Paracoccus sp. ME4 TaxID=3138066 RepID=UPI00398AC717
MSTRAALSVRSCDPGVGRGPDAGPEWRGHARRNTIMKPMNLIPYRPASCNGDDHQIGLRLLDLATDPALIARLDGKHPIASGIIARAALREGNSRELVLSLPPATKHEEPVELLRVLDFDNRQGYEHFSVTAHPTLPEAKVRALMLKMSESFRAAIRVLGRRASARAVDAVDSFLGADLHEPDPDQPMRGRSRPDRGPSGPGPDNGPARIEDQRFRITDDRANQIIL